MRYVNMAETVLKIEPLIQKLRKVRGNATAAARHFGVTRQAVQAFANHHPEVKAVLVEARESMKDLAESRLYKAVVAGEWEAVKFYLTHQAQDRGYIDRIRIDSHDVDEQIKLELARVVGGAEVGSANGTPPAPNRNGDS